MARKPLIGAQTVFTESESDLQTDILPARINNSPDRSDLYSHQAPGKIFALVIANVTLDLGIVRRGEEGEVNVAEKARGVGFCMGSTWNWLCTRWVL